MGSSTRQAIACIFLIFSLAALARAQTTPAKEATAGISGRVTVKGKGVPGVVVTLRRNESNYHRLVAHHRAVTDTEGVYRIVNVLPGNYAVIPITPTLVSADGLDQQRSLIITKGETIEHFDFEMVRGGVITGKVVDPDGRPVIDEPISVFAPYNQHAHLRFDSFTDDRGVYRIFGLRPGRYKVAAGREGSTYNRFMPGHFERVFHPAATDPAAAIVIEVGEGTEATDVNIMLSRPPATYSASGRIVDAETGRPMRNVRYGITRYYDQNRSFSGSADARTNSRGEFKIENLVPGKYGVDLSPEPDSDWRVEEARFEIIDQDVTGLVFKTLKSASISGVIVLEGTDDKAAREQFSRIHLWAWVTNELGQPRTAPSVTVKPDGTFQVRNLASGTVNFQLHSNNASFHLARIERDGVIQPRGFEVKERENISGVRIVVHYGNASLHGRIEVENGPLPPDARFYMWLRRVGEDPNSPASVARPRLDERGSFQFEGLVPAAYEVNAGVFLTSSRKSFAASKQQVVVMAGSISNITVTVDLNSQPTIMRP